jgi:hypothetical protein
MFLRVKHAIEEGQRGRIEPGGIVLHDHTGGFGHFGPEARCHPVRAIRCHQV